MSRRFLRFWPIVVCPLAFATIVAACNGDDETVPATSSTTTTSNGGSTTTSTGAAPVGGGGMGGEGGEAPMPCVGPLVGEDTCPGHPVMVTLGSQQTLCGDTSTAMNDYNEDFIPCQGLGSDGPDLVYAITIANPGTLKLRVRQDPGSTLNPSIYARTTLFGGLGCDDPTAQSYYGCWNFFNTHEEFAFDNSPETFYLFVDGAERSAGKFALDISLTSPACGDGVTNLVTNEDCDDGNTANGDGCTSVCQLEVNTLFDLCDGEPITLLPNAPQIHSGNTTGYGDDYMAAPTGCSPETGARDRVYDILAGGTGMLTATIGLKADGITNVCEDEGLLSPACWDYFLWATGPNVCADTPGNQLACGDTATYGPETISFPVVANNHYFIVVDGYGEPPPPLFPPYPYGPYSLKLELTP